MEEASNARLLRYFDAFPLGYRERPIPAEHTKAVQTGGGCVMPAISVSGRIHGTWNIKSTKDYIGIGVTPFTTISVQLTRELSAEAADLVRFLG